jgi:hypothetical protein
MFEDLYDAFDENGYTIPSEDPKSHGRLAVLEGNFKVIADGTQNRLFIGK